MTDKWDGPNGQTHDESDLVTPAQDVAVGHTQGTEAPRYAPNCKHAYMNDGFDCPFCLRDRLALAERGLDEARRESEWRGLLFDMAFEEDYQMSLSRQGGEWVFVIHAPDGDDLIELRYTTRIPARPDDATVQRIKEAVK